MKDPIFPLSFCFPENLAGTIESIDKYSERNPDNAPKNATCLIVSCACDGKTIYYYIYPGGNTANDFNLRRNDITYLNITIQGKNQNDIRYEDMSANRHIPALES